MLRNFIVLLTVLFIGLKLTNYIAWSWVWVLSPVWVGVLGVFILSFIAIVVTAMSHTNKRF